MRWWRLVQLRAELQGQRKFGGEYIVNAVLTNDMKVWSNKISIGLERYGEHW